ncbi:hypothetical protein GCM10010486_47600 [Nonomuraea roseoviolacea subsp. carminata]
MRLSGAVMAHPRRREAAEKLAGDRLAVVTDPDPGGRPSAFRTSLLAWSSVPRESTHHVVLHDDMVLSGTFFERAERAARAMPRAALALFAFWNSRNGAAVRLGALAGARWVPGAGEYTPVAALLLPRDVAAGYVEWARDRGDTWPDDVLMGRYLRQAGVPVFVAVPSLAEHEDLASLVDNDFQGLRRAPCFFADDPQAGRGEDGPVPSLPVIPFFKRGVAQCAVRVPGTTRWRDILCADYLRGRGVDVDGLRGPGEHGQLWLAAYTMGVVHRGPRGDPEVLDRALATMGPGGLCHALGSRELARLSDGLREVARDGLEAGLAARPRRSGRAAVAVTGSATFVRDQVALLLADRGHRVTGSSSADTVVHVCALGWDPDADPEEELRLAREALAGARHGVLLSSCAVYRRGADAVDEDSPVEPGSAVLAVEAAVPGATVLRLAEPYGPGMPRSGTLPELVLRSSLSRPLRVDGGTAQLVHVRDVATAVEAVLARRPGARVFNVADPVRLRLRELAEAVTGAVRPVPVEEAPGGAEAPVIDAGRAGRELGWRPAVGLDYGLHNLAQWTAYESDRQDTRQAASTTSVSRSRR